MRLHVPPREDPDGWGTIASEAKRNQTFSSSDLEQSFSFFNRDRTRFPFDSLQLATPFSTIRIPLRGRFAIAEESPEKATPDNGRLKLVLVQLVCRCGMWLESSGRTGELKKFSRDFPTVFR
jgi:hypothetical protein